jgi:hypothetical protein
LYRFFGCSVWPLQEGPEQAQDFKVKVLPTIICIPSENIEGGDQPALKVLVSRLHRLCANLQGKYMTNIN